MAPDIKYYNLPYHQCSCRDCKNEATKIAKNYKKYYDMIRDGKKGVEALNKLKIFRMCCRKRYSCIPIIPMIDRSNGRFFDDTTRNAISDDTRELKPGIQPPDFPLLKA